MLPRFSSGAASAFVLGCALLFVAPARGSDCDSVDPAWLFCEDFEQGGLGWDAWYAQSPFVECNGCPDGTNDPTRIRLTDEAGAAHDGDWALHMPAEASAGYRGASLTYRSCAGELRAGCTPLVGYDTLYYRAWVRLASDHQYVHHFMSLGGTRPNNYWDGDGNAGCRPNGYRAAGTTVDFNQSHELFFYTYFPEMRCDSGGYCSGSYAQDICDGCATKEMPCDDGLECCWGNHFSADPRPILPRGEWVCLEMMMTHNTVGASDGEMAFWINDQLGHRQTGMRWRDVPELQLNKVWVQHYIASGDADQSNRIWWDDIIVSTARIGCGARPDAGAAVDAISFSDAASSPDSSARIDSSIARDDASALDDAARPDQGGVIADATPADASSGPAQQVGSPSGCACEARATTGSAAVMSLGGALLALRWIRRRRQR